MVKTPNSADTFFRQQQEALYSMVLQHFSHYGHQTCQLICNAIQQRNGLALLLQRLGIMAPNSFEYQVKALGNYLKEYGAAGFLRAAGGRPDATRSRAAAPPEKPAQEPPGKPEPDAPRSAISTPEPEAVPEIKPEAQAEAETAPLFDEAGRYIGPERRSGIDRRSGTDRRGAIEAIFKNLRFGGERRKVIRRKCDRELAARLGLKPRDFPPHRSKK